MASRPKAKKKKLFTQKEVAEALGLTTRQVLNLERGGVFRVEVLGARKFYPWPETSHTYIRYREELVSQQTGYQEARVRLTKEKADAQEMANRVRRGELIEASDMEALLRAPLGKVNGKLKGVPGRYAGRLATAAGVSRAEAKRILSDIVEEVRAELRQVPREMKGAA